MPSDRRAVCLRQLLKRWVIVLEDLILRFTGILSEEKDVHAELLELSKQKKEAILNNSVSELDKIVSREQALVSRVTQWEKARQRCVDELSVRTGRLASQIDFRSFCDAASPNLRGRLEELHTQMRQQLEELRKVNDINKKMIESRLDYVNFAIDAMTGGGSQAYGSTGSDAPKPKQSSRIYDKKV